jgi:hypothetical protein
MVQQEFSYHTHTLVSIPEAATVLMILSRDTKTKALEDYIIMASIVPQLSRELAIS